MSSRRFTTLAVAVILGIVYFIAGKLSLRLAFFNPSASPVWPPAGIAFAALLVLGTRFWPAIFIGAFFVNLATAGNTATSLALAAGNSLEAFCGAMLVNRFAGGLRVFDRAPDVFKFVGIALLSTSISASIGVTSLGLGGFVRWANYSAVWFTWWLGDMTGYLIVAPAVLLWWIRPRWEENRQRTLEIILLLVLLVILGELVFGDLAKTYTSDYPLGFICGPVIVWTAFRFTQRETITGIIILCAIALWGTLSSHGPYGAGERNLSLLVLQAWAIALTLTTMILAAAMAERRRAEADLAAASKTKDNFLAMLSHELRTPLTPVLALVDLLESEASLDAKARASLSIIRRNIQLESHLIDDLLDLTRVARGKLILERKTIDAHDAIADAIATCRTDLEVKAQHLELHLRATDSYIRADPARFQQIICNLLRNAVKFTPEGGEITIVSGNDSSGRLTVTVQDTGIGIEPAQLDRIFRPFEQGDESSQRRQGGLGLGLAISKALAEAHDATLHGSSDGVGQGATFEITIPTAAPPDLLANEVSGDGVDGARQSWRILLVEDHADSAAALGNLLRRRGHQVDLASDLRSALAAARANGFDLLISDIGLPDGSGAQLMSELRRTGTRGIAISGFGMKTDIEASLASGFSQHLVKPLKLDELEAAIERAMRDGDKPG
jgi:signal transduction histidine kinase/CheY-like chemotaxis protein